MPDSPQDAPPDLHAAFDRLHHTWRDRVRRILRACGVRPSLTPGRSRETTADALEDATQEVFARLWRVFPRLHASLQADLAAGRTPTHSWRRYIPTVVRRVAADATKQQKDRFRLVPIDEYRPTRPNRGAYWSQVAG